MIGMIFVIVILGILSAVAIPKLAATRDDAEVAKIRTDVSSIRSAIISERQTRLIRGESFYIPQLDDASSADKQELFDGNITHQVLTYPVISSLDPITSNPVSGKWIKTGFNNYMVNAGGTIIPFTYYPTQVVDTTPTPDIVYRAGSFDCNRSSDDCTLLLR